MGSDVPGGGPREVSEPRDAGSASLRQGREAWYSAQMVGELWRTVDVMETVARVEMRVAKTLQALSVRGGSEAGARRLRLAGEALGGANTAVERSKYLQREACRWMARGGDEATLRQLLERAAGVLTSLASAERDLAEILLSMAGRVSSQQAAQRGQLAHEASAGARRADTQARLLRELATAKAARTPPAGGDPGTAC